MSLKYVGCEQMASTESVSHPGGNPGENLKSISHRWYLFEVAFVWELTNDTTHLPLGCLQGGHVPRLWELCAMDHP